MKDEKHGSVPGEPRKQSMLYEVCSRCKGAGDLVPGGVRCSCKMLGVVETGATAGQLEYMAKLDTLRQEAGISAAMLRDGRARGVVESAKFLAKLIEERGAIVSSADCSEMELVFARKEGRWYVDPDGMGFVLRRREWRANAEAALEAVHDLHRAEKDVQ